MNPVYAIILVFVGCCSNVVFLEFIVSEHPGSGNIVTFAQFLFIAVEGFIFATHFGTKAPVIPIKHYAVLVMFFFSVSVVNNYALNFSIPLPLHMIFRSGSLVANMALGVILLKKKYPTYKYISILMITLGICTCTLMSAKTGVKKHGAEEEGPMTAYDIAMLSIGLFMLTFALFMSARMGIFQETLYAKYGKHPREALFYSHALPLLGFAVLGKDIYNHTVIFSNSEPLAVPILDVMVPKMWLYLAGNMITQYVCIRGVFILTTECPSLIVTLVVTLRKFFSLVFSILYFKNPFTVYHWMGTACVFSGTLLFTGVFHMAWDRLFPPNKAKKVE
ncbi:UDP-xylose and UDP-N-acetylglucosamine transporter-like [Patiria miniata]|uniref:UDP-xylose and UDP-N-acetylglucosamine transporter n=1 Tax=Patiria miniata TaxID=46514 RepID=A0A913ZRR2_PATMI|nr:UDP-xylose and UDP-N-acetylglucosamine transporter-like [Patiria miniata]